MGGVIRPVGAPTIRSLTGREGTARLGEIIRATGHDKRLALDVLARREWTAIRPLDAIVTYPVLPRDGSLLASSDYDAATRTIAEIRVTVDVPDAPTLADARAALATLSELVCDFTFASATHRTAWLGGVLTVVAPERMSEARAELEAEALRDARLYRNDRTTSGEAGFPSAAEWARGAFDDSFTEGGPLDRDAAWAGLSLRVLGGRGRGVGGRATPRPPELAALGTRHAGPLVRVG